MEKLETAISALFYGRSGTGKTTLASTFPKPLLIIDISERGTDSIHDIPGIDVFSLKNFNELEDIFWELETKKSKYKSVVIDAMHSLQDVSITQVKMDSGKQEDDQTSKRDYGLASGLLKSWMLNYISLTTIGINVIFLAHDRITESDADDEDEDTIIPEVGPRVMPSVASTLTGSVNIVAHTYIKEKLIRGATPKDKKTRQVDYMLRVGPHGFYNTKIRKPKKLILPDSVADPDYKDLLEIIKGTYKPPAPPKAKVKTSEKKVIRRRSGS